MKFKKTVTLSLEELISVKDSLIFYACESKGKLSKNDINELLRLADFFLYD